MFKVIFLIIYQKYLSLLQKYDINNINVFMKTEEILGKIERIVYSKQNSFNPNFVLNNDFKQTKEDC